MEKYLIHLNYDFNLKILNEIFNYETKNFKKYSDPRGTTDNFLIARINDYDYDYIKKIKLDLDLLNSKPRFFILKANSVLGDHIDYNTKCSVNVLLNYDVTAPISIEGKEFYYKKCLLNTQKRHSVNNIYEDRILFKLSIFDESFDQVADKLKKWKNLE